MWEQILSTKGYKTDSDLFNLILDAIVYVSSILVTIQFYTAFCFQVVIHNKDISAFGGEIETKLSQGRQKISQVALFF